jgi:hypothetical protein
MQFALAQEIRELQRVETTTPLCPTSGCWSTKRQKVSISESEGLTSGTAAIDVGRAAAVVAVLLGVGDQFASYERAQTFEDVKRNGFGPILVGRLAHEAQAPSSHVRTATPSPLDHTERPLRSTIRRTANGQRRRGRDPCRPPTGTATELLAPPTRSSHTMQPPISARSAN